MKAETTGCHGMTDIDYHQIGKWVLIALVAGFIGQFGKSFATYLVERARKKKTLAPSERLNDSGEQQGEANIPIGTHEKNRCTGQG